MDQTSPQNALKTKKYTTDLELRIRKNSKLETSLTHTGGKITQLLEQTDGKFIPEQSPLIDCVFAPLTTSVSQCVSGLVKIITHGAAEHQHMHFATKPQDGSGHFVIEKPHQSGLLQFLHLTPLLEILYQKDKTPDSPQSRLMFENLYAILAQTFSGPVEFIRELSALPWMLEEHY